MLHVFQILDVRMMTYNYTRIYLVYLNIPLAAFSPLYPKTIWPFLVLSCCYDDIEIFGGEILACKPVFMLTDRLLCTVGHCCCT